MWKHLSNSLENIKISSSQNSNRRLLFIGRKLWRTGEEAEVGGILLKRSQLAVNDGHYIAYTHMKQWIHMDNILTRTCFKQK